MARLSEIYEKIKPLVSSIPKGMVVSYGEIARAAGFSPRAVGKALSINRDPAVPCHRVVRKDGKLSGYSLGTVVRKRQLLEKEGVVFEGGRVSAMSFYFFTK